MPTTKQLVIRAANRPGTLARIAQTLAQNRINIQGLDSSGPQATVRMLVSNPARALQALRQAKIRARAEDVVLVNLADRPGTLARVTAKLARRGININYAYGTVARGSQRAAIVLGVSNPSRAEKLI